MRFLFLGSAMFSPTSQISTIPALLCKAGGPTLDYTDNIRTISGTPFFRDAVMDNSNTSNLRQARMEFKTTADMKDLLTHAAALDGLDLTSFVLGPAIEKARRVIQEHNSITLSKHGQAALVELLNAQPKPTKAMKELMALPDFPLSKNLGKA
jgi:uncharacterized protein (DUF1778 family)